MIRMANRRMTDSKIATVIRRRFVSDENNASFELELDIVSFKVDVDEAASSFPFPPRQNGNEKGQFLDGAMLVGDDFIMCRRTRGSSFGVEVRGPAASGGGPNSVAHLHT